MDENEFSEHKFGVYLALTVQYVVFILFFDAMGLLQHWMMPHLGLSFHSVLAICAVNFDWAMDIAFHGFNMHMFTLKACVLLYVCYGRLRCGGVRNVVNMAVFVFSACHFYRTFAEMVALEEAHASERLDLDVDSDYNVTIVFKATDPFNASY